jgi:septal ring factor EnvC (AmiA/AmiB activator)
LNGTNSDFGSEESSINAYRTDSKSKPSNAVDSNPIKDELEGYRRKLQEYRSVIQGLTASLDATKTELKNAEDQIDHLRNEFKLLKASRVNEIKDAILGTQSQLASCIERLDTYQKWTAALWRDPAKYAEAFKLAFDWEEYMAENPDLAEAFYRGRISSLFEHWIALGASEGRWGPLKQGPK